MKMIEGKVRREIPWYALWRVAVLALLLLNLIEVSQLRNFQRVYFDSLDSDLLYLRGKMQDFNADVIDLRYRISQAYLERP